MPAIRNSQLFSDCLLHPEPLVDPFYCSEQLIIPASPELLNNAVSTLWRDVRDRLTAADLALRDGDAAGFSAQVEKLDDLLQQDSANFLEFTSFFPTLDVSYSNYRQLPCRERLRFLADAARAYIEKRHRIYSAHGYTQVTVQVRRDFEKHKSGGSSARRKLDAILAQHGYMQADSLAAWRTGKTYVHADNALYEACESWLRKHGLAFVWRDTHQCKLPDLLVHDNGRVLIIECKHLKETGGGQDKQLAELIALIGQQERSCRNNGLHVSYVAYLDGVLFNALCEPRARKMRQQRQDIDDNLRRCPDNYFVNTWGFRQLIG